MCLEELSIWVRKATCRSLARQGARNAPADVDDVCQEVLLRLVQNDFRLLRGWDENRGLSLSNYVALIAQRFASRSRKAKRFRCEEPLEWAPEPATDGSESPEALLESCQRAANIRSKVRATFSARDYALYSALVLGEEPLTAVCERFAISRDAAYAWRSRFLRRVLRSIADKRT